jgi:hypothetical protein
MAGWVRTKARIQSASSQILLSDMAIVLVNLSNRLFEDSRHRLNASAERYGIDTIISYDFEDIRSTSYYEKHRNILDEPTGMGYWLWKPYIILEALKKASEGDIVVYADSGIEIIASPDSLFGLCRDGNPIILFGNGDFPNAMWTKRDCFILMDCDQESFWKAPHCDAAFCLFQRSEESIRFVTEWLKYCEDPRILTDAPNSCGKHDLPDFVEHRRDQSVLSLLAQKYQLSLYRMPTQFGNHYKTHPYRIKSEFNCLNQLRQSQVEYYATIPYHNSAYFQLLDHHRKKSGPDRPASLRYRLLGFLKKLKRYVRR